MIPQFALAMKEEDSAPSSDLHRPLVPLLMRHERQIFAYIYTLVPHRHDAEDILQETCLTIYDKFHEFTLGTDFMAWAMRIAWWKVRAARQKFARAKVVFNDEVMEAISHTAVTMVEETSPMQVALSQCLQKLPDRDRRMVLTRYEHGSGVERAALVSGRSLQAAYKALMRIKQVLHDCVLNTMTREEAA
ncbi:MAG TPA: sigma-70 family RNA polymerase sigma factor [Candidatus Saccharimonadia bacterium]|nr:sigma-70 family RNA polymerase sigma factor [Candidatus Saccharimonadia bacterium]